MVAPLVALELYKLRVPKLLDRMRKHLRSKESTITPGREPTTCLSSAGGSVHKVRNFKQNELRKMYALLQTSNGENRSREEQAKTLRFKKEEICSPQPQKRKRACNSHQRMTRYHNLLNPVGGGDQVWEDP